MKEQTTHRLRKNTCIVTLPFSFVYQHQRQTVRKQLKQDGGQSGAPHPHHPSGVTPNVRNSENRKNLADEL